MAQLDEWFYGHAADFADPDRLAIWEQSAEEKYLQMKPPSGCPHVVIRLCTSCAGAVVYCAACWFEWRTPWAPVWGDCAHHRPVERR